MKVATDSAKGPVAIAQYYPLKNILIAAYIGDGFLRSWDLETGKVLYEHDLGIASSIGVGLDEAGNRIIGAVHNIIQENDYGESADFVGGITVWDTATGFSIACVVYPCERTAPPEQWRRSLISGATLDPKGRWVLSSYGSIISALDTSGVEMPYSSSESDLEGAHRQIILSAFDPANNRYAIGFRDGGVLIEELGKASTRWFANRISLGNPDKDSPHNVTALSFSPDGQWLARIQDEIFTIWKISARDGKPFFEHEIPDGQLLAFDQLSEMLFVSTSGKVEIWDITRMEMIREFAAPEITSLRVSSDNRLMIWGDCLGAVHIWAVR